MTASSISTFVNAELGSITHEAEVDDIIGIFAILDLQHELNGIFFVAANLDALPKFGPEEINVAAVVDRQVRVEAAIEDISASVQQLVSSQAAASATASITDSSAHTIQSMMADMQQHFNTFATSVNARLDHLNAVCNNIVSSNVHQEQSIQIDVVDRKMNIVIFGVKEDRDASVWRQSVNDILQFVSGQPVDVVDMYRIGRFNAIKTRPVLVKLRVVWDRRLILSKCSKLKQYGQRGIFIAPDETLEVRRKQTLDRLKYRAEQAGKNVHITDGTLFIDDVAEFSLATGFLNNTQHG